MAQGFWDEFMFGRDPEVISKEKITPTSTLSPEQQKLFGESLMPFLMSGTGPMAARRAEAAPGGVTPDVPAASMLSLTALERMAESLATGQAAGATTDATTALRDVFTRGPTDFEQFFQSAVEEPALRTFGERVLPGISRQHAGTFYSSDRREADARAREDLLQALTGTRGKLALETREADLNRIVDVLKNLGPIMGGPAKAAGAISGAAGIPFAQEFQAKQAKLAEFVRQTGEPRQIALLALQALGTPMMENIVSAPIISEGGEGEFGKILESLSRVGAAAITGGGSELARFLQGLGQKQTQPTIDLPRGYGSGGVSYSGSRLDR